MCDKGLSMPGALKIDGFKMWVNLLNRNPDKKKKKNLKINKYIRAKKYSVPSYLFDYMLIYGKKKKPTSTEELIVSSVKQWENKKKIKLETYRIVFP